ncbi:MAG TPA: nuclear transport factor 2 family protein [Cyclobacteriaceae bacterium]|nr:nuclear transport factor 2 family protein [Cyclobacteriaceae bacterium]
MRISTLSLMKTRLKLLLIAFVSTSAYSQQIADTTSLKISLEKATAAIRSAFEKGDAVLVARLHSQDVIKYFGGNNVIIGRDAVEKGAKEWFQNSKVEFIGNTVENTRFVGKIAIQSSIFSIKTTPKNGGQPSVGRGRSMVIYVQDESSRTGWLTLREFVQEAPPK